MKYSTLGINFYVGIEVPVVVREGIFTEKK